jgi:capsular exopolysaccharide synthesis family protein
MDSVAHSVPGTKAEPPPAPPNPSAPAAVEFDLSEFFKKLWRRKALIFGTIVVLTAAAAIASFLVKPRYTASSFILLQSRGATIINLDQALATGLDGGGETIESEIELISSRRLAAKAVERLHLETDPEFNANLRPPGLLASVLALREYIPKEWITAVLGSDNAEKLSPEEMRTKELAAVVDAFLERLNVARQGLSRVIGISFTSEDPKTAANAANALADLYILDQLEAKYEATRKSTEWLSEKIAGLRQKVEDSEQAVEDFRKQAGLLEGTGGPLISQEISDLNSQLIIAKTARAEAEARLGQARQLVRSSGGAASAAEVLQSPIIQTLLSQETEVKRKVAELSLEYGERHPRLINARNELKDLESKMTKEVNKIVQGLRNEVGVAQAREASLRRSLDQVKGRMAQSNSAEIQLRALEREAAADKAMLENFLGRFEETSAQEDLKSQQADARVISVADIPSDPSFPKAKLIIALVFVGSAFVGIFLVFVVEQLDSGFRSGEQIERTAHVSVLSLVPAVTGFSAKRQPPYDYILERPTSAFGESIRSLFTSLLLSHVDSPPKTILFTSAQSGEGKTTMVVSLARMLAKSGRNVIVIDTDLRKPSVGKFLKLPATPGLVELLSGEEKFENVVRTDEPSGAHVITAGKYATNAADVVNSDQMRRLLEGLSRSYDMVILDSPPILAVSDARILARLVDRVVFAVRWADTRRATVISSLRQVTSAGAKLAGVVLTMVNVKKHAQYGYSDSGYYYGRVKKYYVD